jgi:TPR repeat protein
MKASLWALLFSVLLGVSAEAQQSAFPTATNMQTTNKATKIAELRAKADKGDAAAQWRLGRIYDWGQGVDNDRAEAVKWYSKAVASYRKAAEQGDADAERALGDAYYTANGVAANVTEAVNWWRKAAEQGNADAQFELGLMYHSGEEVDKDEAKALMWGARQNSSVRLPALGNHCWQRGC